MVPNHRFEGTILKDAGARHHFWLLTLRFFNVIMFLYISKEVGCGILFQIPR